jgi:hypothetical protein
MPLVINKLHNKALKTTAVCRILLKFAVKNNI